MYKMYTGIVGMDLLVSCLGTRCIVYIYDIALLGWVFTGPASDLVPDTACPTFSLYGFGTQAGATFSLHHSGPGSVVSVQLVRYMVLFHTCFFCGS